MEIQNLPMFKELSRVFCSYNIESWQTVDFWDKVKILKVVDSNVNYQSVYRLILRLVKDGYLTIDVEKSRYGQTTYTEAENLHDLRSQFCIESISTLQELKLKKEEFEGEITALKEDIEAFIKNIIFIIFTYNKIIIFNRNNLFFIFFSIFHYI